jgi:hypothetical protein
MDETRALSNLLVGADALLMIAVAAGLLMVAVTTVRSVRPDCVWMLVSAAMLEFFSLVLTQWLAPALLQSLEARIAATPSAALVIAPVFTLVTDLLQALAVGLVAFALVRVAKGRAVTAT